MLAGAFLLVAGTPSAVRADEPADEPNEGGLEVTIVIDGNGSVVDVITNGSSNVSLITNGNSQVFINGNDLYSIVEDGSWARYEITEVIFPWMNTTEARLALTADGLAQVIFVVKAHEAAIVGAYSNLEFMKVSLIGQGQEITKLEEQILAYEYEAYCLSEYVADLQFEAETTDKNILILGSVSGLIFLCLVISLLRLRARYRAS